MLLKVASFFLTLVTLSASTFVNLDIKRSIDVSTPIVKIRDEILAQNQGSKPLETYIFLTDPHITYFHVDFYTENESLLKYVMKRTNETNQAIVSLGKKIPSNEKFKLIVYSYYMNKIFPVYKKKTYSETELIEYEGNVNIYSAYKTLKSEVLVKSKETEFQGLPENDMKMFKYTNVAPYTYEPQIFILESHQGRFLVRKLDRIIDVSHFSRITIMDSVFLENIDSKLVGPIKPNLHESIHQFFITFLPSSAEDIKFYDILGLIHSYKVDDVGDYKILKFSLRYPLAFGWKAKYNLKYTIAMHEYLQSNNLGIFKLEIIPVDPVIKNTVIEDVKVQIRLPEGSVVKGTGKLHGLIRQKDVVSYTSLTYFGRPTLVLTGKNILEYQIQTYSIVYELSDIHLLRVPILSTIYLETVFVVVILFRRANFGLK